MQINPPEKVALDLLRPNSDNPKEAIGKAYLAGLRASIERYGCCGVLNVAANPDGTLTVLDGNTRLDELNRAGLRETWVCRVPACAEGQPNWQAERVTFALGYDRHRKKFNEDAVRRQLEGLAAGGEELKRLAVLSGKANLERLLAEGQVRTISQAAATPAAAAPQMLSFVLYGPASEVGAIKELLKQVKGRLSTLEKARKALGQAVEFLDWSEEKLLAVLLATVGKFGAGE